MAQTLGLALGLFAVASFFVVVANQLGGSPTLLGPYLWLTRLDPAEAPDRVANAAEVVAGVLAVVITVVAIVMELASTRYTHRITQLFVREPVNILVMGFFVVTAVVCLWVATDPGATTPDPLLPNAPAGVAVGLSTLCLLILLPYFAFVFRFLSPLNVVNRMGHAGARALARAATRPRQARAELVDVVEEIVDVARGAQQHSDWRIAMAAVEALVGLLRDASQRRAALPDQWFDLADAGDDPDFVAMAPVVLEQTRSQRIWLETKVLRKFMDLFSTSLGVGRELANLIAIETRRVAEEAHPERPELLDLCVRFFNSYLRASINARDVRSAYYVLDQYRLLTTALLGQDAHRQVCTQAEYLSGYGWLGHEQGQGFLLEVVAHDLGELIEAAAERDPELVDELLGVFLEVDRAPSFGKDALHGVRLAQVRLATFFLAHGDEARARRIHEDMAREPAERLRAVRDEILSDVEAQYREFTDRGVSFAYLPPERRELLATFFAWFEDPRKSGRA